MKTLLRILLAAACLFPWTLTAAQTATARMFCWSVKFNRGHDASGLYSLDLSMLDSGINGELLPLSNASRTHGSGIYLNDETLFDDPIPGSMYLDVPDYPVVPDSNDDGFNDFFDVSCGVSATSQGTFSFPGYASGQVTATWSRAAGSRTGTCALTLKLNAYQSLGTFTHTFEILEYRGTLSYVPDLSSVTGMVSMAQSGVPANTLRGPLVFQKSPTNAFNELVLQPGSLTNDVSQTYVYWDDTYSRIQAWPTNYYGYFAFSDGDLSTAEVDYDIWIMSIDDLNDTDHDGIPDFSDTPAPTRQPAIALSVGTGGLSLQISADPGTTWEVQQTAALGSAWSVLTTVQITTDPQTVTLAVPPDNRFYRLRKP